MRWTKPWTTAGISVSCRERYREEPGWCSHDISGLEFSYSLLSPTENTENETMDFGHLLAFGPPVELSEMAMEIDVVPCMRPYKMKNPPRSYTGLAYMPLRLPQEVLYVGDYNYK